MRRTVLQGITAGLILLAGLTAQASSASSEPRVLPGPGPDLAGRTRHVHGTLVVRPYGNWYHGYGFFLTDHEAYRWLAFTAITLPVLDRLTEAQQRRHESAQVEATTSAIGETIRWAEEGASGEVQAVREGVSTAGRPCREFVQRVRIGSESGETRGTACVQEDGAWEVVTATDTGLGSSEEEGP